MASSTPKSTPKKASVSSKTASSPVVTPSRLTRAQAKAATPKVKTPSPTKKQSPTATPLISKTPSATPTKSSAKKNASSPAVVSSPAKSAKKAAATPTKTSPKVTASPSSSAKKSQSASATIDSPSKATGSHASLARKPTSGLATAQPITAEYSDDDSADEDDDQDQDSELEEGQDVSNKGMQRLLAALGDDGLDEADMNALEELAGDDDDDDDDEEDDDEEEDDDDEEDEEDEVLVEDEDDVQDDEEDVELPSVKPSANGDTLAASIARSGLVQDDESDDDDDEDAEANDDDDDEEIAYEDLPDDVEIPEAAKASRVQRVKVNNEAALRRIYDDIRLDSPSSSTAKLPWIETMRVTYPNSISTEVPDAENDLERELAFYKQALHAAIEGKKLVETSGTIFTRPNDFFAEMVKTDDHMERIRQKLLDETAAIKASEAAKKQRELKKFGKKVQVEKLEERLRKKKEMNERITGLKRKHGNVDDDGAADPGEDQFDVRLEQALADTSGKDSKGRRGADGPNKKARMPRSARDTKYGFGGKKKHAKSNTAESTNDFSIGPTRGARGSKPKTTSGKAGFRPKQKSGAAKRPGKARRAGTR